jgi:hypothetical protein
VTVVYAIALVAGFVALSWWLVADALASSPPSRVTTPGERFGRRSRDGVLGVLGFGMGGMSASFAGWPAPVAVLGAALGAGFVIVAGHVIGDADEGDADESA